MKKKRAIKLLIDDVSKKEQRILTERAGDFYIEEMKSRLADLTDAAEQKDALIDALIKKLILMM